MSTFNPSVPLELIHQHPKNPRRDAIASDELVASVKAQGLMQSLVLAPHPTIEHEYVLIAGHRRLDALARAGYTVAKAEIRTDLVTEVQQIEAMLIENSARQDLTAIEEAEAYEQLQLFNIKAADIARATGRSRQTVQSRLKLLTLGQESRNKVHAGQVTIDDALALVDLPKTDRAELEPLLGKSEFRWKLGQARDRAQQRKKYDAKVAAAAEAGIPAYSDAPVDVWQLQRDGEVLRLHCHLGDTTFATVRAQHAECMRWAQEGSYNGVPNFTLICADPDSHVDENASPSTSVDAEREQRESHYAELRAQAEALAEARRVAARLRWETIAAAKPADVLRAGLPLFLWSSDTASSVLFEVADVLGIPGPTSDYDLADPFWVEALGAAVDKASDATVHLVVAALLADDFTYRAEAGERNPLVARWFDRLADMGHEFSDVDTAQHAAALGTHVDDEAEEVA